VTPFLGWNAPVGRVEGGIDPSSFLFDNPVDRLLITQVLLSNPLREAGVDAVRQFTKGDDESHRQSCRTVHAVAACGVGGLSPHDRMTATTS
jgi:hypothetical protein